MSAHDPRFPAIQQRLKRLGYYDAAIDDEFGPSMAAGVDKALTALEASLGITAPMPPLVKVSHQQGSPLPMAYNWLGDIGVGVLPRHLSAALACYGTVETPGAGNNPTIMSWRDQLKAAGCNIVGYSGDAVPWCGLFMAYALMMAGRVDEIPDGPLWALNWSKFGVDGGQPELGDILTFKREGGGHVAIYIAEDAQGYYHVLGGNQSDKVSIMRIAKARMHSCRQPRYTNKPASVRPIIVSAGGAPISRNEA